MQSSGHKLFDWDKNQLGKFKVSVMVHLHNLCTKHVRVMILGEAAKKKLLMPTAWAAAIAVPLFQWCELPLAEQPACLQQCKNWQELCGLLTGLVASDNRRHQRCWCSHEGHHQQRHAGVGCCCSCCCMCIRPTGSRVVLLGSAGGRQLLRSCGHVSGGVAGVGVRVGFCRRRRVLPLWLLVV